MNSHSTENYNKPFPNGWNQTDCTSSHPGCDVSSADSLTVLLDPSTYDYSNSTFQRNHDVPVASNGYSTDLITQHTLRYIDEAAQSDRPFFVGVAPIAPHGKSNHLENTDTSYFTSPMPAQRHKTLFQHAVVPRGENFNPDSVSGDVSILDVVF